MNPLLLLLGLGGVLLVLTRKSAPSSSTAPPAAPTFTPFPTSSGGIPAQAPSVLTINAGDGTWAAPAVKVGTIVVVIPTSATGINFAASPSLGNALQLAPEDAAAFGGYPAGSTAFVASLPGTTQLQWTWQDALTGAFHQGNTTIAVSA